MKRPTNRIQKRHRKEIIFDLKRQQQKYRSSPASHLCDTYPKDKVKSEEKIFHTLHPTAQRHFSAVDFPQLQVDKTHED